MDPRSSTLYRVGVRADVTALERAADAVKRAGEQDAACRKRRAAIDLGQRTAINVRGLKVSLGRLESRRKRLEDAADRELRSLRTTSALTILGPNSARDLEAAVIADADTAGAPAVLELLERALEQLRTNERTAA